jgi:hypothetical protein
MAIPGITQGQLIVRRAVEVDVLPSAVDSLPDSGFLEPHRFRVAVFVNPLNQTHQADYGRIVTQQPHVGR